MIAEDLRDPDAVMTVLPLVTVRPHREISHRVANGLQLVSALLASQARQMGDPVAREALTTAVQRVAAIASVHRQLYRSDSAHSLDIAGYLLDLATELETACAGSVGRKRIHIHTPQRPVPTDFASALGILVTELVLNACKHAYALEEAGDIDVCLFFPGASDFWLEVRDYGGPVGAARTLHRTGFGSHLIDAMSRGLDGTYAYIPDEEGMRFVLTGRIPPCQASPAGAQPMRP